MACACDALVAAIAENTRIQRAILAEMRGDKGGACPHCGAGIEWIENTSTMGEPRRTCHAMGCGRSFAPTSEEVKRG